LFRSFDGDLLFAHLVVTVFGEHLLHELLGHIYNGVLSADFDGTNDEIWNVGVIGDGPDHVGGTETVGLAGLRYQTDQAG